MMEKNMRFFLVVNGENRYLQTAASVRIDRIVSTWTIYKYDAWRTENIYKARAAARLVGGSVRRFWPYSGDVEVVG